MRVAGGKLANQFLGRFRMDSNDERMGKNFDGVTRPPFISAGVPLIPG
jgi:hypothetical protein